MSSGSLFTNSNWFAFEDDRVNNERMTDSLASPSPADEEMGVSSSNDDVNVNGDMTDTAASQVPETESKTHEAIIAGEEVGRGATSEQNDWVEWRETSNSSDETDKQGEVTNEIEELGNEVEKEISLSAPEPSSSSTIDVPERNDVTNENVGDPLSSCSSNTEIKSFGAGQIPNPDQTKTDLGKAEN